MSETVQLHYKFTEQEWIAASRLYITGQPTLLLRFGVALALLALGLLFFAAIGELSMTLFLASTLGVLIAFLIALFYVLPRQRFRGDPKYRDEYFLEFTDEGIHLTTEHVDSRLSWSLYSSVLENERFYVLVYGKGMISAIPKRAFTAAHQEEAFRQLLRRKLGYTDGSRRLKDLPAQDLEHAYVPTAEPPDWR